MLSAQLLGSSKTGGKTETNRIVRRDLAFVQCYLSYD